LFINPLPQVIFITTKEQSIQGLEQSIIVLKGIGEKMRERFAKRSLYTLNDLLFHLPVRYLDKTRLTPIAECHAGESAFFSGKLLQCNIQTTRNRILNCDINDGSATISMRLFYFNQQQALALIRAAEQGKWLSCYGDIKWGRPCLQIIHPEYRIIESYQSIVIDKTLTPVYPSTEGLSQRIIRQAIAQILPQLSKTEVAELLPLSIRQELKLPTLSEALFYLHNPPPDCSLVDLQQGHNPQQQRLVLEELLAHQLSMKKAYQKQKQRHAYAFRQNNKTHYRKLFLKQLPFKLTQAQQRVIADLEDDLLQAHPMQRLVQGDVGSGKTMVAAMAALYAIENGVQVALMAPTELLAEQHRNNFQQWLQVLGLKVAWLSGKSKVKQRREALKSIADGSAQMVIGTHALFQETVIFYHLGLVIIDEQHRFGVHQRLSLLQKGENNNYYPHQLIMTATPIPRTLAMTAYADLDCSIIDELPPGRTPVATVVIGEQRREQVLQRVYQACLSGRQAYWVCTLIEESEQLQCQAAEKTHELLQQQFPDLAIGLIHGRMKAAEKQAVMHSFKQAELVLLVATTVIEVGVDVANASLMIIENAERLGLSQLHQLRGRVGRGSQSSACVLMHGNPLSKNGKARLKILRENNDGFVIARKDLALRGPGEVMGTRQTGLAEMKIADVIRDQHLIAKVNSLALKLINNYPDTVDAIIKRWIGKKVDYQNV